MQTSEKIDAIAPALLKAQKAINTAHKNAANPFFKSNYADLSECIAAVKGPMNENGISIVQAVSIRADATVVETTLLHESGQWIGSSTPVICAKPNDPQAMGSGISYAKRYGVQAICFLPTEDDDGEKAMDRQSKPPAKPKASQPSQPPKPKPPKPKPDSDCIRFCKERKDIADMIRKMKMGLAEVEKLWAKHKEIGFGDEICRQYDEWQFANERLAKEREAEEAAGENRRDAKKEDTV